MSATSVKWERENTSLKNKEALEVPYIYFLGIKGLLEVASVKSPVVSNYTNEKFNIGNNVHETEESERVPSLLKTSLLFLSHLLKFGNVWATTIV